MAAAMENITNVKLYDLITRWIEVQKLRPDYCDGNPLKVDVMDLTLLLKSMGLKLEYIDFEKEKLNADTLTVQIACNKSGVLAKLSYDLVNCSCPDKNDKETSFWEVQGTGPSVFSKFRNDTSSNLLPEISEKCSMVSKAMLSNLLDYYRTNIKAIERGEDVLQSPLKVATPTICVTSPGLTNHSATPSAEGKIVIEVESSNITEAPRIKTAPDGSIIRPRSLEELQESPQKVLNEQGDTKSNTSSESIGINNATRELSGHGTVNPIMIEPTLSNSHVPDDSSFANSEAMKALITSSPNEKVFDSILNAELNQERDLNVLHCLHQARQQIDAALLVMKLNNPYTDLSKATTITTTPQTVIRNKGAVPKLTERNIAVARRMSLPGRPSDSPRTAVTNTPGIPRKKPTVPSQLAKARGDTPHPGTSNYKAVSMLRKTSSSTSVASTGSVTKTSSAPTMASRKPVGVTKPVGSVRPTASSAIKKTTSIARSVSSTKIDKK
ncbi:AAEL008729-PA [Aedes aegypti]|uniref:AAEL008729-PA n=1 Tax=Aedes aegypti TaxID=7159 RepID=Q16XW8_AEDAE|nr:AAEL008729-PA [Aedes aegypti]